MNDFTLEKRKYIISAAVLLVCIVYVIRLFNLQIVSDEYKDKADSNAFYKKTIYQDVVPIYIFCSRINFIVL